MCGSMLQCVAPCCSVSGDMVKCTPKGVLCVAACCSVLQCVAVCYSVLQYGPECCRVLQCVALCCSAFQRTAVCHTFLQVQRAIVVGMIDGVLLPCVAVGCSELQ